MLVLLSLEAYLMPVVLMLAIRWHSVWRQQPDGAWRWPVPHVSCGACHLSAPVLWLVFDPPFSPRVKGFGLTFYYLIALSVGYYSGYFLLVFRRELGTRFQVRGAPPFNFLNFLTVVVVWLLFLSALVGLIYKNAPLVRAVNGDIFQRYASLMAEHLPRSGACC